MISLCQIPSYSSLYLDPKIIKAIIPKGCEATIILEGGKEVRVRWHLSDAIRCGKELRKAGVVNGY